MLEKMKFALFSVVTLTLLGLFGYWAVATIQSGSQSAMDQKVKELSKQNKDLVAQVSALTDQVSALEPPKVETQPQPQNPAPVAPTVYKYQSLMDALQKLIDGKVILKQTSVGARVGTVQKFLNIYNNTSKKVDNDFGASTVKLVTAFQKDSGLTANGQVNTDTLNKMIDWIKKQV